MPERIIPLNLDLRRYISKPSDSEFSCKDGIKYRLARNKVMIAGAELQSAIECGQTYTAGRLNGTKAETWERQRIVVADIDNDMKLPDGSKAPLPFSDQLSPEAAVKLMSEHGIEPLMVYKSFHHKPEWLRYRIIVLLNEEITDPVVMSELNKKFQGMFPGSDTGTANLDRVFYGSTPDCMIIPCTGKETPVEAIKALPDPVLLSQSNKQHSVVDRIPTANTATGDFDLRPLLDYIEVASLSRENWRNVGMALKAEGYDWTVWDNWSRNDSRYHDGECQRQWNSFKGNGVTGATITHLAKMGGWVSEYETEESWPEMEEWLHRKAERVASATNAASVPEWLDDAMAAEPVPMEQSMFNPLEPFAPDLEPPEFPLQALPAALRIFSRETAAELEVDPAMVSTAVLAVMSLCLAKKYVVRIRGSWTVPLNLYTLIIADSAERKSPVLSAVTSVIYEWQRQKNEELRPAVDRYQTRRDILLHSIESSMKFQKKQNGKQYVASNGAELEDEINNLKDELRELTSHPVSFKALLVDDVTPEAMVSSMQSQDERIGLFSTEGGAFDTFSGRYSSGTPNTDLLLKAWCCDTYEVQRIGRPSEKLRAPALSVLLGCQPSVLHEVMGNERFRDRGLTARFLYCFPKHITGTWDGSIPVSDDTRQEWQDLVTSLLSKDIPEHPDVITIEPAAIPTAAAFYNDVQGKLRGEYKCIQSWAGKYVDQTFRLAGIMAVVSGSTTISEETLKCAIELGEYFRITAMIAHDVDPESGNTILADAKAIWKAIDRDGMTRRDLHRMLQGTFPCVEDMQPGLDELERRGYIRMEERKPEHGGRPSMVIVRNPDINPGN